MVLYAVVTKEFILCKSDKDPQVVRRARGGFLKNQGNQSVASKPKCRRMADQMEPIDVEFLTKVFLEITAGR